MVYSNLYNFINKHFQRVVINRYSKRFFPPRSTSNYSTWHENFIAHLASLIKPSLYIEIGVDKCRTFNKVAPYCKKAIGVDINKKSKKYIIHSSSVEFYNLSSDNFAKLAAKEKLNIDVLFHRRRSQQPAGNQRF